MTLGLRDVQKRRAVTEEHKKTENVAEEEKEIEGIFVT